MQTFVVPIYGCKVYIFAGVEAKIIQYFKKKKIELTSDDIHNLGIEGTEGFVYPLEKKMGSYVLWVKDPQDRVTIEHEAIHLAIRVFEFIGCEVVASTEEPFAYLYEYLAKECWERLNSKKSNVFKNTSKEK